MPNHMKYCKCGQCKAARRTKPVSELIRLAIRAARRKAKEDLRKGDKPDDTFSLPRYG